MTSRTSTSRITLTCTRSTPRPRPTWCRACRRSPAPSRRAALARGPWPPARATNQNAAPFIARAPRSAFSGRPCAPACRRLRPRAGRLFGHGQLDRGHAAWPDQQPAAEGPAAGGVARQPDAEQVAVVGRLDGGVDPAARLECLLDEPRVGAAEVAGPARDDQPLLAVAAAGPELF